MPDIHKYTDFRKYLSDYYEEQKVRAGFFSYRLFSDKIGFKSKDFIYRVIHKDKHISRSSAFKISHAIGHSPEEGRFFENLVCLNQAKTPREKEFYFEQLSITENPEKNIKATLHLDRSQLELFSEWRHLAVRAILDMCEFKDDYAWLGKQLYPQATPKQAKDSVRQLEKLRLVRKDENGIYRITERALTTDSEVNSISLVKFYLACTRLTGQALQDLPKDKRNVSGVTLGISKKNYEEIVSRIKRFREEIAQIANCDNEADSVYQMQIALFPLSDPDRRRGQS